MHCLFPSLPVTVPSEFLMLHCPCCPAARRLQFALLAFGFDPMTVQVPPYPCPLVLSTEQKSLTAEFTEQVEPVAASAEHVAL